ncbi:hypothetical protein EJ03DRAFT_349978 [Teratosphaeria nubilosa]|uniref:ATPase AAA-type core domain-containing protein n=1 Tax=Teratosphaeria nubilosa TaxID=161662 RepID=A0A6G1LEG1_9PEZI|nr:hypothetical protein EJ03DRAFT_349978 [Teratosphaeria nubilosa]
MRQVEHADRDTVTRWRPPALTAPPEGAVGTPTDASASGSTAVLPTISRDETAGHLAHEERLLKLLHQSQQSTVGSQNNTGRKNDAKVGVVRDVPLSKLEAAELNLSGEFGTGSTNRVGDQNSSSQKSNHALQDYQMQLMLLEQQNKKRVLKARQEQDSVAHNSSIGPGLQTPTVNRMLSTPAAQTRSEPVLPIREQGSRSSKLVSRPRNHRDPGFEPPVQNQATRPSSYSSEVQCTPQDQNTEQISTQSGDVNVDRAISSRQDSRVYNPKSGVSPACYGTKTLVGTASTDLFLSGPALYNQSLHVPSYTRVPITDAKEHDMAVDTGSPAPFSKGNRLISVSSLIPRPVRSGSGKQHSHHDSAGGMRKLERSYMANSQPRVVNERRNQFGNVNLCADNPQSFLHPAASSLEVSAPNDTEGSADHAQSFKSQSAGFVQHRLSTPDSFDHQLDSKQYRPEDKPETLCKGGHVGDRLGCRVASPSQDARRSSSREDSRDITLAADSPLIENRDLLDHSVRSCSTITTRQAKDLDGYPHLSRTLQSEVQLNTGSATISNEAKAKLELVDDMSIPAPRWPTLHRLNNHEKSEDEESEDDFTTYLDPPTCILVDKELQLHAQRQIRSEYVWEQRNCHVQFIVYKSWALPPTEKNDSRKKEADQERSEPQLVAEEVHIISDSLRNVLVDLFEGNSGLRCYLPSVHGGRLVLKSPYILHFHFKDVFKEAVAAFDGSLKAEFDLFVAYLQAQTTETESKIASQFAQQLVSAEYMKYLFGPGELLVDTEDGQSFIKKQMTPLVKIDKTGNIWGCDVEEVSFDGSKFTASVRNVLVEASDPHQGLCKIRNLALYPLRFADRDLEGQLLQRGIFFSECQERKYVKQDSTENTHARYMIDTATYRIMHNTGNTHNSTWHHRVVKSDEDDFFLLLPPWLNGFHMQTKKWYKLPVAKLTPVEWDEDAFENLVWAGDREDIDSRKVRAIPHAGVLRHQRAHRYSVAEIARKPLYRVTCGDIGTDPQEVENYLESVFTLGHRWGCVVLLDEADVFLAQHTVNNLERNALVSVFLRVLEYYEGILILTSNRVGIFDEAFKSRIQLAIHYKSLTQDQRLQIWANFITRLEKLGEDLDSVNIRAKLPALAKHEFKGRQIRNIITTSRQLATFKKEPLGYTHLLRAIKITADFEDYVRTLNDGLTEDQLAEEKGDRVSSYPGPKKWQQSE